MKPELPIHVSGRALGPVRHICAFFHSKEEEYRCLMDFIREGMQRQEKAVHIVDARQRDAHRDRLRREGVDVNTAEKDGRLKVACWEDAYLRTVISTSTGRSSIWNPSCARARKKVSR